MNLAIANLSLLSKGGTERFAIELAREMRRRGHKPFFLTREAINDAPVFKLPYGIPVFYFNKRFLMGEKREIERVRKFLLDNGTDVLISLHSTWVHFLWAATCMGSGIPFIYSERTEPERVENIVWNSAGRHSALASADAIHLLLEEYGKTVQQQWMSKVCVIPNPAPIFQNFARPASNDSPTILYLGRFLDTKRADLLLRAFGILAPDFPAWKLVLAGYGEDKEKLHQLSAVLGLTDKATIGPTRENVEEDYAAAQVYCLPTRYEGFPNTVVEAMAAGLPIVGISDCPAMKSLIQNGENGILAKEATPESLAAALKPLLESPELRGGMGKKSFDLCETHYKREKIFDRWESLLINTVKKKGHTVMDIFKKEDFARRADLSSAARRERILN